MDAQDRPDSEFEAEKVILSGLERRRYPRVTMPWPAIVQDSDGRVITGEVIDVSLSGMKLRVGADVVVGDAVMLRVTLPRGAGDMEISALVVRRDPDGIGVNFRRLSAEQADRFKPFVPTWDLRRRAQRVDVELPVQIEGHDFVTELIPGATVAVKLSPKDGHGPMSIRAVVWEVDSRGAVLVFANLRVTDFVRLRSYVDSLLLRRS